MSNIYLNEFDRFMKHTLRPLAYLRYGDDWLCFAEHKIQAEDMRSQAHSSLQQELKLMVNPKIDLVQRGHKGLDYLGVNIWPNSRRLQPQMRERIQARLTAENMPSYQALISKHEKPKKLKEFNWRCNL